MREPIYIADITLFLGRGKGRTLIKDYLIVGNEPSLFWNNDVQRNMLIREVFKTDAKIRNAKNNKEIRILKFDYKSFHGYANDNAGWNCTNFNKDLPLVD